MIDGSASGVIAALAAGVTPIGFVDPNDPRTSRELCECDPSLYFLATVSICSTQYTYVINLVPFCVLSNFTLKKFVTGESRYGFFLADFFSCSFESRRIL